MTGRPTPPRANVPVVRWTPARKAEVVQAVIEGRLSRQDAMRDHSLSAGELASWEARYEGRGIKGLRVADLAATRTTRARRDG